MKIIDLKQGSEEWLEYRKEGIGGSDVPAILGTSPFNSIKDVYDSKKGLKKTFVNNAMKRGTEYEGEARRVLEKEIGYEFPPFCVEHEDHPHYRASLDGYNEQHKEIAEIKIPGLKTYTECAMGRIPPYYIDQMRWQMYIAAVQRGYLMVYRPETMEFTVHLIVQDIHWLSNILPEIENFWKKVICNIVPEQISPKYKVLDQYEDQLNELLNDYTQAKAKIDEMTKEIQRKKQLIIEKCCNESSICGDYKIQKREVSRIEYKIACQDHGIDLEKYKKEVTESWVITKMKEKE